MSNSSMTASRTSPVRTPDALFPAAASSHRADGADVDICTDEGAALRGPVAAEHAAVQPARASRAGSTGEQHPRPSSARAHVPPHTPTHSAPCMPARPRRHTSRRAHTLQPAHPLPAPRHAHAARTPRPPARARVAAAARLRYPPSQSNWLVGLFSTQTLRGMACSQTCLKPVVSNLSSQTCRLKPPPSCLYNPLANLSIQPAGHPVIRPLRLRFSFNVPAQPDPG